MATSISDICAGLETALGAVEGLRVEVPPKISEAVVDTPLAQVVPVSGQVSRANDAQTDRLTFDGSVRVYLHRVRLWVYVRPRGVLGEDLAAQMAMADALNAVIAANRAGPVFGIAGLRAVYWSWEHHALVSGERQFAGLTYDLDLWAY